MLEYVIDGHRVTYSQDDLGRRVWHCTCSDYERRLVRYGEGFCEHLVLAIERAIEVGRITLPADWLGRIAGRKPTQGRTSKRRFISTAKIGRSSALIGSI